MTLLQAFLLGVLQGATEFIPVSSSGHLVLVPWLLGWAPSGLVFDTMVHWGTLAAVITFFWRDLWQIARGTLAALVQRAPLATAEARLGWLLVLATLPAVLAGLLLEEQFEALFGEPTWVAAFLLVTGLILWTSERLGRRTRPLDKLGARDALLVGLAQAMAITPGISRSGSTIGAGLLLGLERPAAARLSFLMMVPIVFGAGLLQLLDVVEVGLTDEAASLLLVGFASAAVTGYACIAFLMRYLATHSVRAFALYCWLAGATCLLVAFLRG